MPEHADDPYYTAQKDEDLGRVIAAYKECSGRLMYVESPNATLTKMMLRHGVPVRDLEPVHNTLAGCNRVNESTGVSCVNAAFEDHVRMHKGVSQYAAIWGDLQTGCMRPEVMHACTRLLVPHGLLMLTLTCSHGHHGSLDEVEHDVRTKMKRAGVKGVRSTKYESKSGRLTMVTLWGRKDKVVATEIAAKAVATEVAAEAVATVDTEAAAETVPSVDLAALRVGDWVKVKYRGCMYPTRVVDTCSDAVKVHYHKWNKRYDEWIDDASRLRPCDPVVSVATRKEDEEDEWDRVDTIVATLTAADVEGRRIVWHRNHKLLELLPGGVRTANGTITNDIVRSCYYKDATLDDAKLFCAEERYYREIGEYREPPVEWDWRKRKKEESVAQCNNEREKRPKAARRECMKPIFFTTRGWAGEVPPYCNALAHAVWVATKVHKETMYVVHRVRMNARSIRVEEKANGWVPSITDVHAHALPLHFDHDGIATKNAVVKMLAKEVRDAWYYDPEDEVVAHLAKRSV